MPATSPAPVARDHLTVLDGGLSTALEALGADLTSALWTARLLGDAPQLVVDAHRAFFDAGAQVAIAASYQASVPGLVAAGFDEDEAARLIASSVALARQARDEATAGSPGRELLVAASVGPYGAVLADGSEYRGRYGISDRELRDFHAPRLELLASTGPDLLAVETIPDVDEARVLVPLLDEIGIPAWFTYSVREGRTNAGQPLDQAYDALAGSPSLVAVGVNCSQPGDVLDAVRAGVAATGLPAVAYPNKGGTWDSTTRTWEGPAGFDLGLVDSWVEAGARYVGGCCGTGPDDIAALAASLTV
ncbi:homocysteine S-methyltransferase [Nocardioides sp. Soil805]|uniref:homocysteine S-methyltransferase n=1 Tax=Nocardioides sp. Soil805 TaxID=1736416 RepID=UPI0007038E21|nr:homocysteine S-methyltransferase [Nocardioides sp. Soil805]KRF37260.1 homocysteine methyltransferase [Nocardioides sp. Soil805]